MTCLELANPTLQEAMWCGIITAVGGELIAAIMLFAIFLYGMHLAKVPPIPSVMIGLVMIFVFRINTRIPIFDTISWIALFAIGAIVALFFWGFSRK